MTSSWVVKKRWQTAYSADSVEWCPVQHYSDLLVCGTYQLDSAKSDNSVQKRVGGIYLFRIKDLTTELAPIQTIETAGVLDLKWCCHTINGDTVLAAATSNGCVQLYKLTKEEPLKLTMWIETTLNTDNLVLSLDWSTNKYHSDPKLVVSDSAGFVSLWAIAENVLTKMEEWKAHDFEAWIAAFDYWHPDIFYSGGDDSLFKAFDSRLANSGSAVVACNRRHGAGVTSIRSDVAVEHRLLTGSYDEFVRVWDARNLKSPKMENNVSGGVWRLKWHPFNENIILAACMYGGFRVLKKLENTLEIISEYTAQNSLAYGADWKYDEKNIIATCSFYDCELLISQFNEQF